MNIALVQGQRENPQIHSWIKTTRRKTAMTNLCCAKNEQISGKSKKLCSISKDPKNSQGSNGWCTGNPFFQITIMTNN